MSKNVADQLVEMLVANGVKRIYAVTGDSLNEFNDAIRRNGKIKWIHVRHEEAGAYAAAAEAELNEDGLACCAGSSGPGHVHLINGLYEANRSGLPMLAIASMIPTHEFGAEYFQNTNPIRLFSDCSYYNEIISTPAQAPRIMQMAIQHAIQRKGVSVIGLPGDITSMAAVEGVTAIYNYKPNPVIRPSDQELNHLAEILNTPDAKVSIFCGIGAGLAHDEVIQLAALLKAPVGY